MVIRRISRAVRLHKLDRALDRAESYAQWQEIAAEHDQLSGAEEWRAGDDTELLHSGELRRSLDTLRKMRAEGETWALSKYLQEVLFRHQGELIQPEIYQIAKLGTKHVVTELLDEIEACFHYLIELDTPEVDDTYRLEQTKRIGRVYGRPALMLSGGALLGLFHFGVIKALFDENLLPRTISGSSMGAIMAGWACVHSDEELRGLFADLSQINCQALTRLPLREALAQRTIMDQPKLLAFLKTVMGDHTLAEAMKRSGRVLNITVSPLHVRQTPRLINYLSAPEALINHAVLASCAVPMVFKPVQLMARRRGKVTPWMEDELWVDGSVNGDLPFDLLRQMLNINHFITSQANPHVVPLLSFYGNRTGVSASLTRAASNIALKSSAELLDLARRHVPGQTLRNSLAKAYAVSNQTYAGNDMHVQLPFRPKLYAKVLNNPSLDEFKAYVRMGEQATWPRLPMIRDRTRLSRMFGTAIGTLMRRMEQNSSPRAKTPRNPPRRKPVT
ncbi:MAG: DUF3336 domain-containing protein [Rhodocyclaceae bacterium]|jgi:TAG lipase/steryl ester hydrolase/phospholipase A2/LPA acyltransferase|nr:DUF3336 domain-containing protein [Rhodocyclaceae bacterium]